MEKSNCGMHGHGMPIESRTIEHKPLQPNGSEMPTKGTTSTTIHESKHFPFIVVETQKTEKETTETTFKIAINNQIISEKTFDSLEKANKYIGSRPWELIINLIGLTYQMMYENETK